MRTRHSPQKLNLTDENFSARAWSGWTKKALAKAADIEAAMEELRPWWPLTRRQIYYRLISSPAVQQWQWMEANRQIDIYAALSILKYMRIDEVVPWESIIDEHRTITEKVGFTDPSKFVNNEIEHYFLKDYKRSTSQNQENYIEVWIEKGALFHIVKPIVDEYCLRTIVCRGFNSVTFEGLFCERAAEALERGQQPIVLYFGDWDPSGEKMIFSCMQTLIAEMKFDKASYYRCAVLPSQFPMIQSDPVTLNPNDKRYTRFVKLHGKTCYELDAFHPIELQNIVRNAIEHFTDMDEYNKHVEQNPYDIEIIETLRNETCDFMRGKMQELGIS